VEGERMKGEGERGKGAREREGKTKGKSNFVPEM
jgi:hypothetical protein